MNISDGGSGSGSGSGGGSEKVELSEAEINSLDRTIDISGRFDNQTFLRLNEVRKHVWNGGMFGLVSGITTGVLVFTATRLKVVQQRFPTLKKVSTRNNVMLGVLVTGSLFSFLGAVTNGKNAVQHIGDIFRKGSSQSKYGSQLQRNEDEVVENMYGEDSFSRREASIARAKEDKDKRA
jgi:hypothetical protein